MQYQHYFLKGAISTIEYFINFDKYVEILRNIENGSKYKNVAS